MPKKWVPQDRHVVGGRPDLPASVVKSAGRALQILEFFDEIRREANVIEICKTLNYPQSSTSALLRSLVAMGFLSYNNATRAYLPTTRVALLGNWINDRLFSNGQLVRLMDSINRRTGNAVLLATRNGLYAQYIHVIQAINLARLHITPGTERSLASSGTGYMLLSAYPDDEVRKIVRAINAYAPAPEAVASITEVLDAMARIRQRGYCFETDLVTPGGGMIAMTVPTGDRQPLVLGVGGVSDVLRRDEAKIVAVMREAIATYIDDAPEEAGDRV